MGWLPEDSSDFIFAIIGEELGLVGALCMKALSWARGSASGGPARSRYVQPLAAAAIAAWMVMQAVVDVGAVIGGFPITGVRCRSSPRGCSRCW